MSTPVIFIIKIMYYETYQSSVCPNSFKHSGSALGHSASARAPEGKRSGSAPPDNVTSVVETVTIARLAGESLGLGLKFEGGSRASERVRRLFVQE